ncbi:Phospholipase D1 [Savitreella phatthalungensis]
MTNESRTSTPELRLRPHTRPQNQSDRTQSSTQLHDQDELEHRPVENQATLAPPAQHHDLMHSIVDRMRAKSDFGGMHLHHSARTKDTQTDDHEHSSQQPRAAQPTRSMSMQETRAAPRSRFDRSLSGRPNPTRNNTGGTTASKSAARDRWDRLRSRLQPGSGSSKVSKRQQPQSMNKDIVSYLMSGTLAASLAASKFLKDDKKKPRIPVLFSMLDFQIKPLEGGGRENQQVEGRLHIPFTVKLQYGTGEASKQWVIKRDLEDFWRLNLALGLRRTLRLGRASKVPKFPSEAVPFFRRARNINSRQSERKERSKGLAKEVGPGLAAGVGALAGAIGGASPMIDHSQHYPEIVAAKLSLWLRDCLVAYTFREECNRVCKFLELSTLSVRLAADERKSGKEGFLVVRSVSGATRGFTCNPLEIKRRHSPRWYLVRESYIAVVSSPEAYTIYDCFYLDHSFEINRRHFLEDWIPSRNDDGHHHPQHHQFHIKNSERRVNLIAKNERQMSQFVESISAMADATPWSKKHRFGSFAPIRMNVAAQWLVDGRDYFWNVSRAIYNARDIIYIHDWWLSPELYLRRPPALSEKWRLDRLLQRKAQEGVKIFVIVYQNVGTTVPIDSTYTKYSLLGLHPNIMVQRSPGHLKQVTFFWAHHEKIMVIDNELAFVGGLDLCFGRWDTHEHLIVDDKPTGRANSKSDDRLNLSEEQRNDRMPEDPQIWPGKDYSNPRVLDFHTLDKPYAELYDRSKIPRMAWHDISMCLHGQAARDVARHYVQRWNYLIRTKPPRQVVPMLLPPPDYDEDELERFGLTGTCEVQILRSSGNWSLGLDATECSIQNAYCELIRESEHFVYVENQFFITSCEVEGTKIENRIGDALVERAIRAHKNKELWRATIVVPMMPGFPGSVDNSEGTALRYIMKCQFNSISRGETSIFGRIRAAGIDPQHYINFFGLRGWGKIGHSPKVLVSEMVYIHAKCMVVDDRIAIIGSANINERSQRGNRDSEVAAVVRDTDMVDSTMGGVPFRVGRFAHTLRMRLMREHLGVNVDELEQQEFNMDGLVKAIKYDKDAKPWNPEQCRGQGIGGSSPKDKAITDAGSSRAQSASKYAKEKWSILDANDRLRKDKANADGRDARIPTRSIDAPGVDDGWFDKHEEINVPNDFGRAEVTTTANALAHGIPSTMQRSENFAEEMEHAKRDPDAGLSLSKHKTFQNSKSGLPYDSSVHRIEAAREKIKAMFEASGIDATPNQPLVHLGAGNAGPFDSLTEEEANTGKKPFDEAAEQPFTNPLTGEPIASVDPHGFKDPIIDEFYVDVWCSLAVSNTDIFREVFRCQPDDQVRTWKQYHKWEKYSEELAKLQGGHRTQQDLSKDAPGGGPVGAPASKKHRGGEATAERAKADAAQRHDDTNGIAGTLESDSSETLANGEKGRDTGDDDDDESDYDEKKRESQLDLEAARTTTTTSNANSNANATTAGPRRKFGDIHLPTVPMMEKMLCGVRGHLVIWPTEWLIEEDLKNNWLYTMDRVQPIEIYD